MNKYLDKSKYVFAKKQNIQMFRIKVILVNSLLQKWKKSDIVNKFEKEMIARRTVYANTKRLQSGCLSKKWTTDLLDS